MTAFPPLPDFVPVAPMPAATLARYATVVEPALQEFWREQGIGIFGPGGLLKLIDPDRYLTMIGEYLPAPDMLPVMATALGDIVVWWRGGYRVAFYRYLGLGHLATSLAQFGRAAAAREWLDEILLAQPYREAAAAYGELTSPADLDQIYLYRLALPAGGRPEIGNQTRGRIFENISITTQLVGPIPVD